MDPARTTNDVMGLAERRLGWLDRRQAVLAQNVANASTPGYQARDTKSFGQFLAGAASGPSAQVAQTNPGHLPGTHALTSPGVTRDRSATHRAPNGNNVALDEQALKIAEVDQAHGMAINLHHRYMGLFRTALGR